MYICIKWRKNVVYAIVSLEKGTDCGLTAVELWLLRAKIAKKEGLSSHYKCAKGAVKRVYTRILHQITNACIFKVVLKTTNLEKSNEIYK